MKRKLRLNRLGPILIVLLAIFMSACGTDDPEKQAERDRKKIIDYLKKNGLEEQATELPSGVFYIITKEGEGPFPNETSAVSVTYVGKILSGREFASGYQTTIYLSSTFVVGLKYGLQMFNRGSEGMLFIPSGLGYGPYGSYNVPANAVLMYDIEMIDFQ